MPSWRDLIGPAGQAGRVGVEHDVAAAADEAARGCVGRPARVGHKPVRVAGLAALAVGPSLRVNRRPPVLGVQRLRLSATAGPRWSARPPAASTRSCPGCWAESRPASLARMRWLGAARHGLRLVRAERVEEVDEVVADGLVGRDLVIAGRVTCSARRRSRSDSSVFGFCESVSRAWSSCSRRSASSGRAREGGHPGASAPFTSGRARRSSAAPGRRRARDVGEAGQERRLHAERLGRGRERRRRLRDRVLERLRVAVDAANVSACSPNSRPAPRPPAPPGRPPRPSAGISRRSSVSRIGQVAHDRLQVARGTASARGSPC